MKKALIFSDSHGRIENMLDVISKNKDVDAIFHAGDIERDADRLRNSVMCPVYIVKGNCDWFGSMPEKITVEFAGKKVAICHGHRYLNMGNKDLLTYFGREEGADLVIFGHTHVPFLEQAYPVTLLNPGSISRPRQTPHVPTYTILTVDDRGEMNFDMREYRPSGD